MKMILITLFVLVGFYSSCSHSFCERTEDKVLDYSNDAMWYSYDKGNKIADVFYITPTCIWDWVDTDGDTIHYMNTADTLQRAAVDGSNRLAASLFSNSCRFFSPYYRQITMNSWMQSPDEIEKRYTIAHKDVENAFDYYMKHLNGGRPFILAGHSQGAKAVLELLKHRINDNEMKRLVAAYMFGYEVTQSELERYKHLKPAHDSLDCGVVICYNSVSSPKAVCPLFKDNVVCINPINWRTDTTYATPNENIGSVFFNQDGSSDTLYHTVGARINTQINTMIIDGLLDENYYIPSIGQLFPMGNYHVQEINLYFLNLQKNIEQRIVAFTQKQ